MTTFLLQLRARSGELLSHRQIEVPHIHAALAEANRSARAMARRGARGLSPDRIDIADRHGDTVGRVIWAEMHAATV